MNRELRDPLTASSTLDYGSFALGGLLTDEAALWEYSSSGSSSGRSGRHYESSRWRKVVGGLVLSFLLTIPAGANPVEEPVYDIDIPSMDAAEALNRFAEQTGAIMLFPYDLASSRKANAVNGQYTLLEGLDLLLQDTGLSAGLSDKRVVNISLAKSEQRQTGEEAMRTDNQSFGKKLTAIVASVFSATAATAQDDEHAAAQEIEEIVVTGQALATQRAIGAKLRSAAIMDAVAADDINKLPVKNAAEAVDFLPGVSITTDQGEGRFVTIRGAASYLNNVTLNGSTIGSPSGGNGREVPLDVIGGELLKGIEVFKAVTPDLDHQAIGGSVNILTYSPFDFDSPFAVGSIRVGYENNSGDVPYSGAMQAGGRFGQAENWALLIGASYTLRKFESNSLFADDWAPTAVADVNGNVTTFDTLIPQQVNSNFYQIERNRKAFNAALERQGDDGSRIFLRALYSIFPEVEQRDRIEQRIAQTADGLSFTGSVDGNSGTFGPITVVEEGEIDQVNLRRHSEMQALERDWRVSNLTAGGDKPFGRFHLFYEASYNDNSSDHAGVNWEWRNTNTAGTWDVASLPRLQFGLDETDFDPAEYRMQRFRIFNDIVDEEGLSAKLDLRYDLDQFAENAYLKFGLFYRDVDKRQDLNQAYYDFDDVCTMGAFDLATAPKENQVDGVVYRVEPRLDPALGLEFFSNSPNCFVFDPASTLEDDTLSDFQIDEQVSAAYAMGSYNITERLNVLLGVRVEHTENTANALVIDFTALDELTDTGGDLQDAVSPAPSVDGSYTNVLPSLHLRYNAGDSLVVRAAYTNTIGRPFMSDLSPATELEFEDDPVDPTRFIGAVSTGNVSLDPYTSRNFDISIEYYLEDNLGIVSAAFFYKDIDDYILRRERRVQDVTFNDRNFSILDIDEPFNAESGEIRGIELHYRQQWSFLPGFWSGLGGAIAATFVDSEIDVGGRMLPFPRQSDEVYTAQVFYSTDRIDTSLSLNHHGQYLGSVEDDAFTDLWIEERTRLDFHARYNFSDRFGMFFEWQNILDDPWWEYQGGDDSRLATGREYYDSTIHLGLAYRY